MSFQSQPRGYALRGTVWVGGSSAEQPDWVVVADAAGQISSIGPAGESLPHGVPILDVGWIGPGIIDAHVHMGFGSFDTQLVRGVVGVRDLGAPDGLLERWRRELATAQGRAPRPHLAATGPLLTAPQGYPSQSWGKDGYARFISSVAEAEAAVAELAHDGADLIKLALEPGGGAPVPSQEIADAVVIAAHSHGLKVTAHALVNAMVERALSAGVDELCHTPVEKLSDALVEQIADSRTAVVSTLATFVAGGAGRHATKNARRLVEAGVPLVYGTDLGNAGTSEGIDTRELRLLAEAGLGVRGALLSATEGAAGAYGFGGGAGPGRLEAGQQLRAIGLRSSPLSSKKPWTAFEQAPLVALGPWLKP